MFTVLNLVLCNLESFSECHIICLLNRHDRSIPLLKMKHKHNTVFFITILDKQPPPLLARYLKNKQTSIHTISFFTHILHLSYEQHKTFPKSSLPTGGNVNVIHSLVNVGRCTNLLMSPVSLSRRSVVPRSRFLSTAAQISKARRTGVPIPAASPTIQA